MAKSVIDLTNTGLVIGSVTVDWVKQISDGASVSLTSHTLTERGNGIYIYDNSNITEDSDFRIHETATPANSVVGVLSPADGDLALDSTVAKEATLNTHESNRATMETTLVAEHDNTQTKIDTVQADLDNPNQYMADVSGLSLEATAQSILSETNSHPTLSEIEVSTVLAREVTVQNEAQKLLSIIESQRGCHTGMTTVFYWDPVNGNDSNDGLTISTAKLTYDLADTTGGIHGLLSDSNHDIIIILPGQSAGTTEITEHVDLDTRYTFLRGPGRDVFFNGNGGPSVLKLSAEGCELSGIRVNTNPTGSQDAIEVTGNFAKIHNVWIDYSRGHGIFINNVNQCIIENFIIENAAQSGSSHGIYIDGSGAGATRNKILDGTILNCNGDGIHIKGGGAIDNFIYGKTILHDNSGYGVGESGSADHTMVVGPTVHVNHNTLGKYNLIGAQSFAENIEQWANDSDTAKEATLISEHVTTNGLIKENRHYNLYVEDVIRENEVATSSQELRKVPLGRTDYIITKIKDNDAVDWSETTISGAVYAHYRNIEDTVPYKIGGES